MHQLLAEHEIAYTGEQLRSHWILHTFGQFGDAMCAFLGPCEVPTDHLVDLADVREGAIIRARMMLHTIAEWFDADLERTILRQRLRELGHDYGDFAAHAGLWDMAEKTTGDVLARMALVPRLLEARGLDATPPIRQKLAEAGDPASAAIGHGAGWTCEVRASHLLLINPLGEVLDALQELARRLLLDVLAAPGHRERSEQAARALRHARRHRRRRQEHARRVARRRARAQCQHVSSPHVATR